MPETVTKTAARLTAVPVWLLLGLVRVYQKLVSPVLPAVLGPSCGCRFYPTCSHYAIEALRTHGAIRGSWLTGKRLIKCTPLHPGGNDPVPARRRTCQRVESSPSPVSSSLSHG